MESNRDEESGYLANSRVAALVLLVFLLVVFGVPAAIKALLPGMETHRYWTLRNAVQVLLCVATTAAIRPQGLREALRALRVYAPLRGPALMALTATLPFPLIYWFAGAVSDELSVAGLFFDAAVFPFAEELIYRGFAFWLLHRWAKWPFWLAAVVPAVAFSYGHLYQADGVGQAAGILAITGAGAIWFSWLLWRWNSLWAPIAMHALMNGYWAIFDLDSTALGGGLANVARGVSIVLSIVITNRVTQPPRKSVG